MKILYVTDLHGDKNKYRKSLEIAMKQEIRVIVNGGDMLPKLGERHTEQPLFIKGFPFPLPLFYRAIGHRLAEGLGDSIPGSSGVRQELP